MGSLEGLGGLGGVCGGHKPPLNCMHPKIVENFQKLSRGRQSCWFLCLAPHAPPGGVKNFGGQIFNFSWNVKICCQKKSPPTGPPLAKSPPRGVKTFWHKLFYVIVSKKLTTFTFGAKQRVFKIWSDTLKFYYIGHLEKFWHFEKILNTGQLVVWAIAVQCNSRETSKFEQNEILSYCSVAVMLCRSSKYELNETSSFLSL